MAAVAPNLPKINGTADLPAPGAKKVKGKKDKPSAEENAKLIQARLAQLEKDQAGERTIKEEIDKEVKKESKHIDEELTRLTDPLERADAVRKKYDALLADMKKLERELAKSKKKADQLQKDKDKATGEFTKVNSQKEKMEKLTRTFQQENKKLKDDNKKLEDTERTAREVVNNRLDDMLYDVQDVMNSRASGHAENLHMEVDDVIKTRCKVLFDQAELRELHFKSILRHKDAEIAHLAAKHELERKRADGETSKNRSLSSQVSTFSHTEAELRSQLNIYVEKFKQVEDTLNNSNELFLTFRKEMEEMSKKTKMLEKENNRLTRKHDQVKKNILDMATERDRHLKEIEKYKQADTKMRAIIKSMQDQGRGGNVQQEMIDDDDGTESDYEEEDYDDEEDGDYIDETEEEALAREEAERQQAAVIQQHNQVHQQALQQAGHVQQAFGPQPPPLPQIPAKEALVHRQTNGTATQPLKPTVNGVKH